MVYACRHFWKIIETGVQSPRLHTSLTTSLSRIRHRKKPQEISVRRPPANHQIRVKEIRLIDENGVNKGIVATESAIRQAIDVGMDLVAIAPSATPPVARIVDLGKYMYELEKKERDTKKKQKDNNVVKGIRISMRMSSHDLEIQAQKLDGFLQKGNKVRVELMMRGREKALRDLADERIKTFLSLIQEPHKIEQEPQRQPRGLFLVISKT